MGDKLLIRAYDVEVGDCIYVRIPKARVVPGGTDDFHMLIDCGTKGRKSLMKRTIEQLESILPSVDPSDPASKKRLDLIVVTHEHQDHIKGFDPEYFKNIAIGNIWLSVAMDPNHKQAEGANSLHSFAKSAMRGLTAEGVTLTPELQGLVSLFSIDNDNAMNALRTELPQQNGITTKYVHADSIEADLDLNLKDTVIKVLGPEKDIDRFYLGDMTSNTLHGLQEASSEFGVPDDYLGTEPSNISSGEFRRLRTRMLSNALAFAELSSKLKNNTSTVLLIEWGGKRLLFVGDLEWESSFEEGRHNGGWNVIWHERNEELNDPIHFLKVGHHGSTNSTPWNDREDGSVTEPSKILDAILPLPVAGSSPVAKAVVSTMRKNYKTIPKSALLVELGKRVSNTREYDHALQQVGVEIASLPKFEEYEKEWINDKQPWRTDHEGLLDNTGFIDIEIDPV